MLSTHFREPHAPQQRELQFLDLLARLAADYLERKRAKETEKLLLREVQHRSNNLLTVVQAIAHQTFSGAKSFDDAKKAFEGRLLSLAQCNKQITKSITGEVRLRNIVHLQVEPFAGRVSAHGPDISIGPQQAQNLSMLLHELVTNAAKHGALRRPSGKVEITWLLNRLHEALQLTWQERDGPPVTAPRHSGFGTMLLKATFPKAQLDYQPGGLLCQIDVPIAKDDATASL
jgi:two-component sensor histidine kinase